MPAQKDFSITWQKRFSMSAMWVCVSGAQYSFEDHRKSFFLSLGQGFYNFQESPKSIQDVTGDVCCSGKYCFNTEKSEFFDGYVITPRSIRGCGKRRAWWFVQKVLFMLHEHAKTTKTKKTRFFFR